MFFTPKAPRYNTTLSHFRCKGIQLYKMRLWINVRTGVMPMAGDFRLAYEQREVGQSQESVTRQPGQRARDVFESSCKQTQFSSHTHHNHTYVQSARMWQIDRYAERLNFKRRKREKKHSRCCTRVVKKKSHSAFLSYFKSVSYFPRVSRSIHSARV